MRHVPRFLTLALLTSACAVSSAEITTTSSAEPTFESSTTTSGATPPSTFGPATTLAFGPPVGWVAPSGVPVAVTGVDGETIEVLTPCGAEAVLTDGLPIRDPVVMLDPGHGGPVDTGAVAPTGLSEKEINLRVARATRDLLEEAGISTVLSRVGDYPIPIRTRVEYAHLMQVEALVSIHHNAPVASASEIPGVEVFVQAGSSESQRLGGLLYDEALSSLEPFDIDWDRAADAGVMTVINSSGDDAYGMVRLPEIPSALVELGYIANRAEAELFQRPEYVTAAARSIALAVESFLTSDREGAGMAEGRTFNPSPGVGPDQCIEPDLEHALYPDVLEADASALGDTYSFDVKISSPYDSPDRYADAFRVVGDDGVVYGVRELTHDHANEQPFTRSLTGVALPDHVRQVTIEGRDQVYGWGGATVELILPGS